MTSTNDDDIREPTYDQPSGEAPEPGAEGWQDEVSLDADSSERIADADLDPTLGYDLTDTDGPPERTIGRWLWVLLAVVVVALATWWWLSRDDSTPLRPRTQTQPGEETRARPSVPVDLPELSVSDAFVRGLVSEIAAHPALTRWLANEDLIRRLTGAVEVIAEGGVPRDNLDFLGPDSGFQAVATDVDLWRASAAGHQRFDEVLKVMQLVDPADAARIVKTIEPLADEARRDLGYPDGGSRAALDRAIAHLVRVSPQLADESLVREGEVYLYNDPDVEEGLSSVQKALLRLGSEQVAWVQAWLHRFHDALAAQ